MERIASFQVNHDTLEPGVYVSRIDGDITTYANGQMDVGRVATP